MVLQIHFGPFVLFFLGALVDEVGSNPTGLKGRRFIYLAREGKIYYPLPFFFWFLSIAQRGQFEKTLCGEFSEIMANISIETRIW